MIDHSFDEQYMISCTFIVMAMLIFGLIYCGIKDLRDKKDSSVLIAVVGIGLTIVLFVALVWIGG